MNTYMQAFVRFIGIALMLLMASIFQTQMRDVRDYFIVTALGAEWIPPLKSMALPVAILSALFLLALTRKGRICLAFDCIFPLNILFFGIYAYLAAEQSPHLANPAILCLFYLWASVSSIVLFVLIWGFANQKYTFKQAAFQYPVLGLILFLSASYSGMFSEWARGNISNPIGNACLFAIFFNAMILTVYLFLKKWEKGAGELGKKVSWSYFAALAVIVFCIKFSSFFPILYLKGLLKEVYADPTSYINFLSALSVLKGKYLVIAGVFGVLLGGVIYAKGPASLGWIGGAVLSVTGIAGGFAFFGAGATLDQYTFERDVMGNVLISVSMAVFLILFKELSYFAIEWKNRFNAKIAIDLMVLSFAEFASTMTAGGMVAGGGILENRNFFAALFFLSLLFCFIALLRIHFEMRKGLPNNSPLPENRVGG